MGVDEQAMEALAYARRGNRAIYVARDNLDASEVGRFAGLPEQALFHATHRVGNGSIDITTHLWMRIDLYGRPGRVFLGAGVEGLLTDPERDFLCSIDPYRAYAQTGVTFTKKKFETQAFFLGKRVDPAPGDFELMIRSGLSPATWQRESGEPRRPVARRRATQLCEEFEAQRAWSKKFDRAWDACMAISARNDDRVFEERLMELREIVSEVWATGGEDD